MRVRIRDFQSLHEVDLDAKGFTVITGPTNVGKTAIIRAVYGAIFGKPGDHYIRNGEHTTKVKLEDSDLELFWQKTNKPAKDRMTCLKANGVLHTKLGRDHAQLTAPLGFMELETSTKVLRPQIALQHDPHFLVMGISDTEIAELMKKVARADVTTKASDLVRRDRRDTSAKLNTRRTDRDEAETKLNELNQLPNLVLMRDKARREAVALEAKERSHADLIAKLQQLPTLAPRPTPARPPEIKTPPQVKQLALLDELTKVQAKPVPGRPPEIKTPPQVENLTKLESLIALRKEFRQVLQQQTEDLRRQLGTIEDERFELEKVLKVCPTCDRPFESHDA